MPISSLARVFRFCVAITLTTFAIGKPISTVEENLAMGQVIDESGYQGAVLVFRLSDQSILAGHSEQIDTQFLPASTFKVFSALVALETGVIENETETIKWDGVERSRSEINRDLDLRSAFRLSALPHFQHLVRQIGAERMQHYIDKVGYGNRTISGGLDRFWISGDMKISPRQQVAFLIRLYKSDLPFRAENMQCVKEMMRAEEADGTVIRAKTGWTTNANGESIGWWVGWKEAPDDVIFFATVIVSKSPGDNFGATRFSATRKALQIADGLGESRKLK